MGSKTYFAIGGVVLVVLVIAGIWFFTDVGNTVLNTPISEDDGFSKNTELSGQLASEVEAILNQKINSVRLLAEDQDIIKGIQAIGEKHEGISQTEIDVLDAKWRVVGEDDPFIAEHTDAGVSERLRVFQQENLGFSEIFVTDQRGLNAGQTNKTTDYYQADEAWWVGAYNNGSGKEYFGAIEFDESSLTQAISLYVPVFDATGEVIGIMKAVLSIDALTKEL